MARKGFFDGVIHEQGPEEEGEQDLQVAMGRIFEAEGEQVPRPRGGGMYVVLGRQWGGAFDRIGGGRAEGLDREPWETSLYRAFSAPPPPQRPWVLF